MISRNTLREERPVADEVKSQGHGDRKTVSQADVKEGKLSLQDLRCGSQEQERRVEDQMAKPREIER
jgi:hypothetical protein